MSIPTKDTIEIKNKVMIQKIDKLYLLCNMLFYSVSSEESKAIQIIKEGYLQMYQKIMETRLYDKYKEVEDIIFKEMAKIELGIERYIYGTAKKHKDILERYIQRIYQSENYQNFQHLEELLEEIKNIKEMFKLYNPYIGENAIQEVQREIAKVKFDVLYRRQVEQLIYENGTDKSNLLQQDSEIEKEVFKERLQKKIEEIKGSFEEDEIFKVPLNEIMESSKLLERIILMDIKKNAHSYIPLTKAKIFNAHLCNIGNKPFEKDTYMTAEEMELYGCLKVDKANYALLEAILKNIITDENISLGECEYLYKRFGFKCDPILVNIGQACVKMILEETGERAVFEREKEQSNKNFVGQYCKMRFNISQYYFKKEKVDREDIWEEILDQRDIALESEEKYEDFIQKRKEKVERKGMLIIDIDIMISLIEDLSDMPLERRINGNESYQKLYYDDLQYLKILKYRNEKIGLEQYKEILLIMNRLYKYYSIYCDPRQTLPLECMTSKNSSQVYLAEVPSRYYLREIYYGRKSVKELYIETNIKPLWQKCERDFKELKIDVRAMTDHKDNEQYFPIAVCLENIKDLPIDYTKVNMLTKEELERIVQEEKEKEG